MARVGSWLLALRYVYVVPRCVLSQADALDAILRRRLRTVSRGLAPDAFIPPPWDTATADPTQAFSGSPFSDGLGGGAAFLDAYDSSGGGEQPWESHEGTGYANESYAAAEAAAWEERMYAEQARLTVPGPPGGAAAAAARFRFEPPPRPEFGAHHEERDRGMSRFKGSPVVKALDARSKALVGAPDRGAFAGVAPMPNNARKERNHGARLVMRDALDMIAQENQERGYT